ncbi:Sensor histidine kinase RcsC [Sinobacterium norvegicum]|uniref:histidine kinase n=2 Tax=Sinobacterium norvegicum TaxID=1641715 RepID=A0ABN8EG77_9GAMM|nr:Sensor histidine kinase RcsC [Sinobacterium norvegicum]
MRASQSIFRVRRQYNQWVGNQTLEDYALRFTAKTARRFSIGQVGLTALGATAFLALEALAAASTLQYGFINTLWAMLTVALVIFLTGLPISYYSAKHGLDIDLLTRGAGFGYLGSTVTSLIYASFTFIFFAIEAAIFASALNALFSIPLALGYILSALVVVPIVTHGISAISRFQIGSQPLWLILQLTALFSVAYYEFDQVSNWASYAPADVPQGGGFSLMLFGASASLFFAMVAQIGEQADYLRFMPEKTAANKRNWWFWLILAGPGWIFIGLIKMLFGSFLAYLAIVNLVDYEQAIDPVYLYQLAFGYVTESPTMALLLAGVMVLISQMKINVTNAYAGSIAWSNFFSRLTHSHPGRVVWLIFNLVIAVILMELGIYRALEAVLGIFSIVAISWLASLSADLLINKPLKLSPSIIEFKRGHLHDINPVGVGSWLFSSIFGISCYLGVFGDNASYLAHFISLLSCFILVPGIAWLTGGRFYLARTSPELDALIASDKNAAVFNPVLPHQHTSIECCICETAFEQEDMSYCTAYLGPICSLCCSIDARCLDSCKPEARLGGQLYKRIKALLPQRLEPVADSHWLRFILIFGAANLLNTLLLALVYFHLQPQVGDQSAFVEQVIWAVFYTLFILSGVVSWLFVLAHESRIVAQQESNRQTQWLIDEIDAHQKTDKELQLAKEVAESANSAKTRYLSGISHELRTPLQSILGYAQLLADKKDIPEQHQQGLRIIKRSGEYLTDLIEGLLDISKIEAGRLDIYRNKVNILALIEQMTEMFRPQAEAKGLVFNCHIHHQLPQQVIADERRLRQILINLLSNAVKYTEQGQIDFHIRYRNQVAEFSVVDSGVGIDKNDLARVLDPFERVRNEQVVNIHGTGLGLTIVRLLTEIMGGNLEVDSEIGEGSSFTVSLMLSWVNNKGSESDSAELEQRRIVGLAGVTKTVMIVDDEPLHRGLLTDILAPLGFITVEAGDGEQALSMLSDITPDLFLLDVSMPGMSGLDLAQLLRNQHYQTPIIMLSADATERHRSPEDHHAHDDYMVKPIRNQLLLEKIATLLALRWRYEDEEPRVYSSSGTSQPTVETVSLKQWLPPEHPLMDELLSYVQIGHKKGVTKVLAALEQQAVVDGEIIASLQELVLSMRFDSIEALLSREQNV